MEKQAIKEKIEQLSKQLYPEIKEIRHHLHAHPELSGEETATCAYISKQLKAYGITHKTGIAKTGIVGLIEGNNPGKRVIALRADLDALPIQERNNVDYISKTPGIMHACGHDVHMASLLGAAKILQELKKHITGSVKLIFQPSEEKSPGGAHTMITEGVLEHPEVNSIVAQHVQPSIPAGKVGFRPGMYMASSDEIYITVKGKGGHAALPGLTVDPILTGLEIRLALDKLFKEKIVPKAPTLLNFGRFIGDGRTNIIPAEVSMEGTLRTFNEDWRAEAKQLIRETAERIAESRGAKCQVNYAPGYPCVTNDSDLAGRLKKFAVEYLGSENVIDLDMRFTAEDFAYFTQKIPGCLYRLGVGNESKGIVSELHTATFDVDEESLRTGMGLMAWLVISELNQW